MISPLMMILINLYLFHQNLDTRLPGLSLAFNNTQDKHKTASRICCRLLKAAVCASNASTEVNGVVTAWGKKLVSVDGCHGG